MQVTQTCKNDKLMLRSEKLRGLVKWVYENKTDLPVKQLQPSERDGISRHGDGMVSHDSVTRLLSERPFTSKDLWLQVKAVIPQIETEDAALIFEGRIIETCHTDENDIICWHYDHNKGRNVKGINLLNALYHSAGTSTPIAF